MRGSQFLPSKHQQQRSRGNLLYVIARLSAQLSDAAPDIITRVRVQFLDILRSRFLYLMGSWCEAHLGLGMQWAASLPACSAVLASTTVLSLH
jgi:hypothetical protein